MSGSFSFKQKFILFISITLIFFISFIYGYYLYSRALITEESSSIYAESDQGDIKFDIEKIEKKDSLIHVQGWAIKPGELFKEALSQYILYLEESGKFFKLRTWTYERLDIGQLYNPNYTDYLYNFDHDFAGMSAVINTRKLIPGIYRVFILFDNGNTQRFFDSGRTIKIEEK